MLKTLSLSLLVVFWIAGCRSHEEKARDLEKEYAQLAQQYRTDCSSEMLNVPEKVSEKCASEDKQVTAAWNRLESERRKH